MGCAQRHAPSALYPREWHYNTNWRGGWVGLGVLDTETREKVLRLCSGSNPCHPVCSQTLYWLSVEYSLKYLHLSIVYTVLLFYCDLYPATEARDHMSNGEKRDNRLRYLYRKNKRWPLSRSCWETAVNCSRSCWETDVNCGVIYWYITRNSDFWLSTSLVSSCMDLTCNLI
jgi:hypothetical protein